MFVVKFYSSPEQRQTRREAGTQSFRSEAPIATSDSGVAGKEIRIPMRLPSLRIAARRFGTHASWERQDRTCAIVGRQIVLLALSTLHARSVRRRRRRMSSSRRRQFRPADHQGTPVTILAAGSAYSFKPTAADPDGDPLTFSASNVPGWASFDRYDRRAHRHAHRSQRRHDRHDHHRGQRLAWRSTQLPAFRIEVVSSATVPPPPNGNTAPTITGTPATTATVGQVYTFAPVGDDADDDTLTYSIAEQAELGHVHAGHRRTARHAGQQRRRHDQQHRDSRQ